MLAAAVLVDLALQSIVQIRDVGKTLLFAQRVVHEFIKGDPLGVGACPQVSPSPDLVDDVSTQLEVSVE